MKCDENFIKYYFDFFNFFVIDFIRLKVIYQIFLQHNMTFFQVFVDNTEVLRYNKTQINSNAMIGLKEEVYCIFRKSLVDVKRQCYSYRARP